MCPRVLLYVLVCFYLVLYVSVCLYFLLVYVSSMLALRLYTSLVELLFHMTLIMIVMMAALYTSSALSLR